MKSAETNSLTLSLSSFERALKTFQVKFDRDPGVIILQVFMFVGNKTCDGNFIIQKEVEDIVTRIYPHQVSSKIYKSYVDSLRLANLIKVTKFGANNRITLTEEGLKTYIEIRANLTINVKTLGDINHADIPAR